MAQITSTSWIPADAKPFLSGILTKAQTESPDCAMTMYIDGYRVADLISGGMGGCGGYDVLWGKTGGVWKQIIGGQDVPDCAAVRKVWSGTIPTDFFGGRCLEGGAVVPFTP